MSVKKYLPAPHLVFHDQTGQGLALFLLQPFKEPIALPSLTHLHGPPHRRLHHKSQILQILGRVSRFPAGQHLAQLALHGQNPGSGGMGEVAWV